MYCYRSSAFNAQVHEKAGLAEHVDRLCRELETMPLEQVLSRFERVYPYLKRKESNLRLIARIRRIGNEPILCWLRVFRRGDRDYEEFLRDRQDWANNILDTQIPDSLLWDWLNEQKNNSENQPQPTSPPLSESLRRWLDRPSLRMDFNGVVIYESEAWLARFAEPHCRSEWRTFNRIITELADAEGDRGEPTPWDGIRLYCEPEHAILYSRITTADHPTRQVLFLIAPFRDRPDPDTLQTILDPLWKISHHHHNGEQNRYLFSSQTPTTLDELTTIARRAYPDYLLADETNWLEIETDERANLALSAEEEAILHNVSTQKPSLPLFLNGQAGSGKSTMLFHLFADYCHRHLRYCTEEGRPCLSFPRPLFLAYNDRLLKVAKERVIPLLASHHRFLERRGQSEALPDISPFFQSFRTFLRNRLPLAERNRFNDANYVSFHYFRQQYLKTRRRVYSPEVCWQVIRTFIKGYHLDERDTYLEVDDYREIPRKERTVSVEDFDAIYETVWKWYDRTLKDEGKWDDQDLIRRVLQLKCYRGEFTAIFCDEAQDFTHLELQLIMRLSVFSQYDLEHQHVESLPFAFAGDPLQTLNPTGFRWSSLKAAFYNEVITTLSPTGMLDLEMNFEELESNYRSAAPIVRVNNLIQLWRSVLFDLPEIQPQQARKGGDQLPQKWIVGREVTDETVQHQFQDTIVIVPCDQGGEADFVRRDPVLRVLQTGRKRGAPWNVLSAIAAKGLEFKQVVLYKFGEACPTGAWNPHSEHSEEARYFFNKLYVAASRATERLVIVDSPEGDRQLWRHGSDVAELDRFLAAHPKHRQQWESHIQLISTGDGTATISADDLPAIAQTLFDEGLHTENADLMYRAQEAYERLGDTVQAARCEAWSHKFAEQYEAAGKQFVAQGDDVEAWNCFWQGECWMQLKAWYHHCDWGEIRDHDFTVQPTEVRPLVQFMATVEPTVATVDQFTAFLATLIASQRLEDYRFMGPWKAVIDRYREAIASHCAQATATMLAEQWQAWGEVLRNLAGAEYEGMDTLAGECFYYAARYEDAIATWNHCGQQDTPAYHLAQAQVRGLPAGLVELVQAGQHDEALNAWGAANCPNTENWLPGIILALLAQSRWLEALDYAQQLEDGELIPQVITAAQDQGEGETVLLILLQNATQAEQWEAAIAHLEAYPALLHTPNAQRLGITAHLVQALAHANLEPSDLHRDLRRRYEQFLKDHVLLAPDWGQPPADSDAIALSMPEVGIALERVGAIAESLSFYDQFTQDPNILLRDFARDRWLVVKKKQDQSLTRQGNVRRALKARNDLQKKATQWQCDAEALDLTIPPPLSISVTADTTPEHLISGLPPDVEVSPQPPDGLSLQLKHLHIQAIPRFAQVQIRDQLSQQTLRIDGQAQQISLNQAVISGELPLRFQHPSCGYQGVLHPSHLELTIAPYPDPIYIHWPTTP